VLSLSDQLKPWEIVAKRLDAAGAADLVIALYNPGSQARRTAIVDARDVLLRHRKPDTPVIVGRAVGAPDEKVTIVALGDLSADHADMRTLLIVGSSHTRISYDADGTPRAFTPRTYS
jgi:precorrin-2 C20-methyltransferase/precorrin-3B C17-methyltransferase